MQNNLHHLILTPKLLAAAPIILSLHKACFNKDTQDADKKIKDVRKQYHSNKNYTYCDPMIDLGLRFNQAT